MRRPADEPGERAVAFTVVDRVAELVEHGLHPSLARLDVAQHAHVAFTIDVDAERVLALAVARVQVAVCEHGSEIEAEAVVRAHGERLDVGVLEEVVERDGTGGGRVLEERIIEMPGPEIVLRAPESRRQRRIELTLPLRERLLGRAVDVGQRREEPVFVELAGAQREREVIAIAEVSRRLVAQLHELPDVAGHLGSDLLGGVPCPLALGGIVARAEDLGDRVVVDPDAVDLPAENC